MFRLKSVGIRHISLATSAAAGGEVLPEIVATCALMKVIWVTRKWKIARGGKPDRRIAAECRAGARVL